MHYGSGEEIADDSAILSSVYFLAVNMKCAKTLREPISLTLPTLNCKYVFFESGMP